MLVSALTATVAGSVAPRYSSQLNQVRSAGQTGRPNLTMCATPDTNDADFRQPGWSLVAADATVYEVG